MSDRKRLLITGGAGYVARQLRKYFRDQYDLRLLDVRPIEDEEDVVLGSMTDLDTMLGACEGVDTVIHLGIGVRPDGSRPDDLMIDTDMVGTYYAFEAARRRGCRRLIFGSSVAAISMYDRKIFVTEDMPPKPGGLYGLSKTFGEGLGKQYADAGHLTAAAIRLFTPNSYETARKRALEGEVWILESWISPRDMAQLFRRSIESDHVHFEIFHGLSDNTRRRWGIQRAVEVVGYRSEDNAEHLLDADWVAPE